MMENRAHLTGAQIGGQTQGHAVYGPEFQIRRLALEMAIQIMGDSISQPEMAVDAAEKILVFLRGETATKN